MAVSNFRGRRWTAWFAPDIPMSDGPWKFSGLPGLIMEAHDTKKHIVIYEKMYIVTYRLHIHKEKGIKRIWIQQMTGSKAVEEMLCDKPLDVVYNRCILLHANPTGVHKFHRMLLGLFGRLPD